MSQHNIPKGEQAILEQDAQLLHKMGYAQELARSMHAFSNFAISFSIICILAGGITSFQLGFSAAGGFAFGVGWIVGSVFALIVAASMAQIASAYPTAGGLYHWSSILGGRLWGWATAVINLLGLIFVCASVNVGVYSLFINLILSPIFGVDISTFGTTQQIIGMVIITVSQSLFNHYGIKLTTKITDFSGYLIFVVAVLLTATMIGHTTSFDFSRLYTFVNTTGDVGGGVYPATTNGLLAFGLGLLVTLYTITGFDASAHTSEETVDARVNVPKGMIRSVLFSAIFGFIMTCSFVLAMPDTAASAKDGANVFFNLMTALKLPGWYQDALYIGIVIANYCCGLACVTSTSRMLYAFSRDGGLPKPLRHVSPKYRTPVPAIWTACVLAIAATLYSPAFAALAAGCAVFLYISYAMPIAAGFFAEGKKWTEFGPFRLGLWSKPFAILTLLGVIVLTFVGMQPPNDIVISYAIGVLVVMAVAWIILELVNPFQGPPIGDKAVAARHDEIAAEEKAVGEPVHQDGI